MIKLLICDDEPKIVEVLKEYAIYNGFEVDVCYNGSEALDKVEVSNYDCIIIDIMMPELNGYDTIKTIRQFKNIPVIIMSAKTEEFDILHGFELGADDYVCKPFSPREIMARVKAVIKRTGVTEKIKIGNLQIDTDGHEVFVNDEKIKLTNKEYELLIYLLKNKGIVLSREKLLNSIWINSFDGDERTVDTHIKMLRADLKECARYIITVRGVGYKFDENV